MKDVLFDLGINVNNKGNTRHLSLSKDEDFDEDCKSRFGYLRTDLLQTFSSRKMSLFIIIE